MKVTYELSKDVAVSVKCISNISIELLTLGTTVCACMTKMFKEKFGANNLKNR